MNRAEITDRKVAACFINNPSEMIGCFRLAILPVDGVSRGKKNALFTDDAE